MAYQVTKPSTSLADETPNFAEKGYNKKKKPGTSRQFTIHKYLGKEETPRPQFEDPKIGKNDGDCFEGEEGMSCTDIDAEAAQTWIYPGSDEFGLLLLLLFFFFFSLSFSPAYLVWLHFFFLFMGDEGF